MYHPSRHNFVMGNQKGRRGWEVGKRGKYDPEAVLRSFSVTVRVNYRSRILERTFSLSFPSKILSVFRLEVSVYNVYIKNQFQTTFAQGA